jgi:hypothetical protein
MIKSTSENVIIAVFKSIFYLKNIKIIFLVFLDYYFLHQYIKTIQKH